MRFTSASSPESKGPRKNNFPFSHLISRSSSADPQSRNPQNSPAIPAVSCREANALGVLNQIDKIQPESEREFCELILARTLGAIPGRRNDRT
jgi:hypothetical protein